MRTFRFVTLAASAYALSGFGLYAQSVISAHSGVLHYFEGEVTVQGQVPHNKTGTFADIKQNEVLQTEVGRAEVLLTPGAFLRVGENSSIRMTSNKLDDTQIAFEKGSAIVDFVEVTKDNSVKITFQDYDVTFLKKGIYRFDSEPAQVKVYSGEALVTRGGSSVRVKDGRVLPFTPALVADKFDNRTGDSLYRWAKRRSEYIAVANLSAAKRMSSGYSSSGTSSSWYYNPYYSMYTFIPGRGILCDPFAMYACYYSPYAAYQYYYPRPVYNGGGGGGFGNGAYNSAGYYPTASGNSSTLSTYGNNNTYSAPSVAPSYSPAASSAPSGGFSGGGASAAGGGGMAAGGGGGGASHGGGSAGGHGK